MQSKPPSEVPTVPGYKPLAVGLRALQVAREHLGECETAPNEGPPVDWSIAPWTHHKASEPRDGKSGWAFWCGAFVSTCILLAISDSEQAAIWRTIGSLDVDELWQRLDALGWTFLRGERDPLPGDLLFLINLDEHGAPVLHHTGLPNLRHVGLVEGRNGLIATVEGNHKNCIARNTYPATAAEVYGFARIPW